MFSKDINYAFNTHNLWQLNEANILKNLPTPQNLPLVGTVSFSRKRNDGGTTRSYINLRSLQTRGNSRLRLGIWVVVSGLRTSVPKEDTQYQIETKEFGKVTQEKQQAVRAITPDGD